MPRIAIATNDFEQTISLFRDQFGMPVIDMSATSVDSLGAKLGMCVPPGGSNIELMCPAVAEAALSQSLQRFLDRRGEGLFALMLEAPDPDAEAQRLLANGLNVLPLMAGAGGRDIHPNSTHGVLIRIYPDNSFQGHEDETKESLALSGIVRVVIAVRDLDAATSVYGEKLGLAVDAQVIDAARGVRSILCHPPSGGVIELVSVHDSEQPFAEQVQQFLSERGEGMYMLYLQSSDLERSVSGLNERGLAVNESGVSPEIVPSPSCVVRIGIEVG